ncbi:MAG: regulatory protein GemA [Rhodobacteraceae bacterium]|nr:regulatory protein GemA [Paracoccaceae bacterium]
MSRALQKLIHAGCRELGIDADTRHDLQLATTGKASLSEMTEAELQLVVDRLKEKGFRPVARGGGRREQAPRADLRLIHVLWSALGRAGKLEKPGRAGLNAFIRRRFGAAWGSVPADIDMLRDHARISAVIEALKQWCDREGVPFDRDR